MLKATRYNSKLRILSFVIQFSGKVIVVSKCDESIDFENSVIEIQPYDGANRNCTWVMFAPSGSQIILDIKEYGNKSSLKIFDGLRFEDTNLLAQRKSDRIESTGNILKIQYISDIIDARGGLRISYETTGKSKINKMKYFRN